MITFILGMILLLVGTVDNLKYWWQARKLLKYKSSVLISRKFLTVSFISHLVGTLYVISKGDMILNFTYGLGIITTGYLFWVAYKLYPQRPKKRRKNVAVFVMDAFNLLPSAGRERYGFYSDRKHKQLAKDLD